MSHQSSLIAADIEAYLAEHEQKDLLRLLTCGSVDDGKSTLIGRLLHDSKMIYEDQLAAVKADSVAQGSSGEEVDLALLMDGLKAEREQGITIDVAYRYFSTARRKFIIADTPGHEQYTRNMVTGASGCDLAVLLIDARQGMQVQTRRHSYLVSLLGIRHLVVVVNKMDLVDYAEQRFEEIRSSYLDFATSLAITDPYVLPISALAGDNVVEPSQKMPWFGGLPLMEHLETVEISRNTSADLRYPVQLVIRPDLDFRGYAGTVASGTVQVDDDILVLPSRKRSQVQRIVTYDGDLLSASAGKAVTLTLSDEIDVSRGDLLVHPGALAFRGHRVDAMLVWMAETPMSPGKQYLMRQSVKTTNCAVVALHHRVDVNSLKECPASVLELNEIGKISLGLDEEVFYDPYTENRVTGAFILIDRLTNATVGAGMALSPVASESVDSLWGALPASEGLVDPRSEVTREERAHGYGQCAVTLLITGFSNAGKTTVAKAVERRLFELGKTTLRLDGQNMRLGISKDLGFSSQERSENLRRSAEIAKLANDQGIICICAFVAPKADVRERARSLIGPDRFLEVHLDTPIEVCRARDDRGLYKAADAGEIPLFPGVTATYDRPVAPDLRLRTDQKNSMECAEEIVAFLQRQGILQVLSEIPDKTTSSCQD